jgi:hypothetical protein
MFTKQALSYKSFPSIGYERILPVEFWLIILGRRELSNYIFLTSSYFLSFEFSFFSGKLVLALGSVSLFVCFTGFEG